MDRRRLRQWLCSSGSSFRDWRNALRQVIGLLREPAVVSSQPISLQIEPIVRCNFACTMCHSPERSRAHPAPLSLDRYRAILDQFPHVRFLTLQGVGEPLLNPELTAMIREAKRRRIAIGLFTNGSLLTPDISAAFADIPLDWLNVSLDGATAATFEQIRLGGRFDQVVQNLRECLRIRGRRQAPVIGLWCVASRANLGELPALVELAGELGVDRVTVQEMHAWGDPVWRERLVGERISGSDPAFHAAAQQARRAAQHRRVRLDIRPATGSAPARRSCQWPWKSTYVTVEGFVTPCCMQGSDPAILNFGNLTDASFAEIWNSDGYQQFRRQLRGPTPPPICQGCPGYHHR
ncbi:MAG: SPASM domain-containing protein [Candidatus Omnitrophica bacterium]|nr:SPASM domain-containing protein [Candidatus Omnitrophota bacterium]